MPERSTICVRATSATHERFCVGDDLTGSRGRDRELARHDRDRDQQPAWSVGMGHAPSVARARHLCNLSRYLKIRGHIAEGRVWFRRFLASPEVDDSGRAGLLRRGATFATVQDDYDEARAFNDECRSIYELLRDVGGVAETIHNLAVIRQREGRASAAADQYALAIEKFRETGNDYGRIVALLNLALLAFARNDLDEAERRIDKRRSRSSTATPICVSTSSPRAAGGLCGEVTTKPPRARFAKRPRSSARSAIEMMRQTQRTPLAIASIRLGRVAEAVAAAQETIRTAIRGWI